MSGLGSFISSLLSATHADAAEEKPAAPEVSAEHTIEEPKEEEEDPRMCVLLYSEPSSKPSPSSLSFSSLIAMELNFAAP
ncbi:hypothetical protein DFH09DRAFT_1321893 [Mycena vulgaris]|nr:hypothetical protein DFH09DRAFT_1321893 [Mycena vulgaris]